MALFVLSFTAGVDTQGNFRDGYLIADSNFGYLAAVKSEAKSSRCLIEEFGEDLGQRLRLKEISSLDVTHKQYVELLDRYGKTGKRRADNETIEHFINK
jgi:hypothetical protein